MSRGTGVGQSWNTFFHPTKYPENRPQKEICIIKELNTQKLEFCLLLSFGEKTSAASTSPFERQRPTFSNPGSPALTIHLYTVRPVIMHLSVIV